MSLTQRIEGTGTASQVTRQRWVRLRTQVRASLVERLGYAQLARIAATPDGTRAREELAVTLRSILLDGRYASLTCEERERIATEVMDDIIGLGPLEPLIADPDVTEVMVNGTNSLFYEKEGRLHPSERVFDSDEQVRSVIERILAPLGRRIDEQSPLVNARLANGFRVNAVIPPIAMDGPHITIRKFSRSICTLEELVRLGSLPAWYAWLLRLAVRLRMDIAVVGGTGSGKTSLLNALSVQIAHDERIVTIEDSAELKFQEHPHVVRLEAREASIEGSGAVTIRDLVTNSLRMRPDRIVVGEVRGAEAIDMLQAMNTGHDGSLTTLHAGSPREAVLRLVLMARFGMDLPPQIIEAQIGTAFDLIVMTHRMPDGRRYVGGLTAVGSTDEGKVELTDLVGFDPRNRDWELPREPDWVTQAMEEGFLDEEEVLSWRRSFGSPEQQVAC